MTDRFSGARQLPGLVPGTEPKPEAPEPFWILSLQVFSGSRPPPIRGHQTYQREMLNMATLRASYALAASNAFRACRPLRRQPGAGAGAGFLRRSSTAAGLLPLEGIRVLDMTRVLAGVSAST